MPNENPHLCGCAAKKQIPIINPTNSIQVNAYTTRSTIIHELAHAIEYKVAGVRGFTRGWLKQRVGKEKLQKLSKLTGNPKYEPWEKAWEDKFVERGGSVYSGKSYSDVSEVLTMGIERLIKPPSRFLIEDPDYFELVVRILKEL